VDRRRIFDCLGWAGLFPKLRLSPTHTVAICAARIARTGPNKTDSVGQRLLCVVNSWFWGKSAIRHTQAPTEFFFQSSREIPGHPRPDGQQPQNRVGASISRPRFGGVARARHVLVLASTHAFAPRGVAVPGHRPEPSRHQPSHQFINLILERRLRFVLPFRFGSTTAIRFDSQYQLAG